MSRARFVSAIMPRKERVEALADGIFSVAMTLLVLDIKLPESAQFASNADALAHFASVGEAFATYMVSFLVLAMFWISHDYQFRYVERLDRPLLWINIVFLLLTTIVPFTTNLVARQPQLSLFVTLYASNLLALSAMLMLHAWRLRKHRDLATRAFTDFIGDRIFSRIRLVSMVPVLAIAVAQFSPPWGMRMFYLLAAMHFVPHSRAPDESVDRPSDSSAPGE